MTRITFGIIALNAQPFLEYNLRSLYPFAHQLIVVEGATRAAASIADRDGHSIDDTLSALRDFQKNQDPERKLIIVSAREEGFADGFWPEKGVMSQAYAKRATGDWLWQVDSDEFYRDEDLPAVVQMLDRYPSVTAISFPYLEFFGGFSSTITGVWHRNEHPRFHRLFRWGRNYSYKSHRPPTVVDENGIDLRQKKWISSPRNSGQLIYLYHYSYVFPRQAKQKVTYYSNVDWTNAFRQNANWMRDEYLNLMHPMFLSERGWPALQWLERFSGKHPSAIDQIRMNIDSGQIKEPVRPTQDIERLLNSPVYSLEKSLARLFLFVYWPLRVIWKQIRSRIVKKSATSIN